MQRSDLVELLAEPGPSVSVYLATTDDVDADAVVAGVASRLAPFPWAEAAVLRSAVTAAITQDASGTAVFFTEHRDAVAGSLVDPPALDLVIHDDLPYVAPLVEASRRDVSHLVVHAGADDTTFTTFTSVESDASEVHAPGLSPDTVARLGADVVAMASESRSDLVIIDQRDAAGGDLLAEVAAHLPPHRRLKEVADGKRDLADEVVALVADAAARDIVEVLHDYRFAVAHGGAVSGVDATLEALASGRVATLLLHDDPDDGRTVVIGPGATHIGPAARAAHGGGGPWTVRLSSGLIRSCLLTGGEVRIIPEHLADGPADGVGAVLIR